MGNSNNLKEAYYYNFNEKNRKNYEGIYLESKIFHSRAGLFISIIADIDIS